jgi:hypothetical protein
VLSFEQRISGLAPDGTELRAAVFDENEVRAAAGLTLVIGAVAFSYAHFAHNYLRQAEALRLDARLA